jgi:hypothetical protein
VRRGTVCGNAMRPILRVMDDGHRPRPPELFEPFARFAR